MIGVEQSRAAKERVAACVGIDEMDRARLRLLLRLAGERLSERWRMGEIEHADLLFIATGTEGLGMLVSRARGQGIRCVIVGGPEGLPDVLPMPLDLEHLVDVLTHPGSGRTGLTLVSPDSPDFFSGDLPPTSPPQQRGELVDFDTLYPRDVPGLEEARERPPPPRAPRLDEIAPSVAPSRPAPATPPRRNPFLRDDALTDERPNPFLGGHNAAPPQATARRNPFMKDEAGEALPDWSLQAIDRPLHPRGEERTPVKTAPAAGPTRPLCEFLGEGQLVGPSQVSLPGQPPLVVDPKWGNFYFHGALREAEPYLRAQLTREDWRPVTNSQLRRLREHEPGKRVERLLWLDALLRAGGFLPRHLDPGGTYRLWRMLDLDDSFAVQQRIAAQLMEPHRLHEVVAATSTSMPEVFDVIAAYDAIGLVDWTHRERLR